MCCKVDIHGVRLNNITMQQALENILNYIKGKQPHMVFTPNSEIIMHAQRDEELKFILNSADLLLPDGAGVVLSSRILNKNLVQKVSGIDLVKNLIHLSKKNPMSFYLLGSKSETIKKAALNLVSEYPYIRIAGIHHGYFKEDENTEIIKQINMSAPDILLVGMGAPKQEKWIYNNLNRLKVKVCIGVGGTFDVFSGEAKLAPEFIRRLGFEWLYRLIMEPRRFKRMLDLPRFMFLTLKVRIRNSISRECK